MDVFKADASNDLRLVLLIIYIVTGLGISVAVFPDNRTSVFFFPEKIIVGNCLFTVRMVKLDINHDMKFSFVEP